MACLPGDPDNQLRHLAQYTAPATTAYCDRLSMSATSIMHSLSVVRTILDKGHLWDTALEERKCRALISDQRVNFVEADLVIRM